MPRRVVGLIVALAFVGAPSMSVSVRAQTTGIREVSASARSLIPLQTRLRYTTMIVLPEGEEILDVICGDKDFWVITATQNIAHVKPAKEGAATNLNLVTASGDGLLVPAHGEERRVDAGPQGLRQRRPERPEGQAEVLQRGAGRSLQAELDGGTSRRGSGEQTRG